MGSSSAWIYDLDRIPKAIKKTTSVSQVLSQNTLDVILKILDGLPNDDINFRVAVWRNRVSGNFAIGDPEAAVVAQQEEATSITNDDETTRVTKWYQNI